MTPPMYDATYIDIWKVKMPMYLKTLGMHVYLATTYIEANTQALDVLKHSFSKEYLSIVSHCDSAFTI